MPVLHLVLGWGSCCVSVCKGRNIFPCPGSGCSSSLGCVPPLGMGSQRQLWAARGLTLGSNILQDPSPTSSFLPPPVSPSSCPFPTTDHLLLDRSDLHDGQAQPVQTCCYIPWRMEASAGWCISTLQHGLHPGQCRCVLLALLQPA